MRTLICLLVLSLTAASAAVSGSISAGYREKDITFGDISSRQGAYYTNADLLVSSFHLGVNVANNLSLKDTSMYQTDLVAGYKFFSTLADVEVGGVAVFKGKPVVTDMAQHTRPFVSLNRGPLTLVGKMDLEAKTTNVELQAAQPAHLVGDFDGKLGVYVGYTDVNDARPRSVKELKYTNAYAGGSLDITWKKFVGVGVYAVHSGHTADTTFGWRSYVTKKF